MTARYVLVRVGGLRCGLPLGRVLETMRPLPAAALADAPPFVLGLSVIRGSATPVVDLRLVVEGVRAPAPGRFVLVAAGERKMALAVDGVDQIRTIDKAALGEQMPSILGVAVKEHLEAIGVLDGGLLALFRECPVVPEEVWRAAADADGSGSGRG